MSIHHHYILQLGQSLTWYSPQKPQRRFIPNYTSAPKLHTQTGRCFLFSPNTVGVICECLATKYLFIYFFVFCFYYLPVRESDVAISVPVWFTSGLLLFVWQAKTYNRMRVYVVGEISNVDKPCIFIIKIDMGCRTTKIKIESDRVLVQN